jgi:hypothetical protein
MNRDVLVAAVSGQLDALRSYRNAIVVLAVAAAWGGLRRSRELEAFGIKFDRRHTFWIFGSADLVANVAVLTAIHSVLQTIPAARGELTLRFDSALARDRSA